MKRIKFAGLLVLSVIMFVNFGWTREQKQQQLTASQILDKVDNVINPPKDQDLMVKLVLIDKKGKEKIREMSMLQKGSDKRIVKFLSPAEQKGIAFLSLPDDIMYLYLPAFKKVRRIASHVKNTKFAGTDFTYEDMEAKRYSEKWVPQLLETKETSYILELKLKDGEESDYLKLIMHIRKDNFYPVKIEHFDKGGNLYKIMIREKIKQVKGYWISEESRMEDLKTRHKTDMIILEANFDLGLSDDKFTKRYLSR